MGTGYDLRPDHGIFSTEYPGINTFQLIPAKISIPVTGGKLKMAFPDPVILKSFQYFGLVVVSNLFIVCKQFLHVLFRLTDQG